MVIHLDQIQGVVPFWFIGSRGLEGQTYAARAESSSNRAVLTFARAFMAKPIEVDRVACQGVTKRSAMMLS